MKKAQVKAVVKLLGKKDLDTRPALQQVFERDGHLWASDGYVCFDICEVKDRLLGKRAIIPDMKSWLANAKDSDIFDNFIENGHSEPEMKLLFDCEFEPCGDFCVNIDNLKLACDFLTCKSFSLERSKTNRNLYRVVPNEGEQDIMVKAMESKAYVMGVEK